MTKPRPTELGALARLATLATGLGLVALALLRVGRRLPGPPLTSASGRSLHGWSLWLGRVGPAGAMMSGVRLVGLGLAGYLLAVVTIELLGRAAGLPRLLSFGHRLSTPLTRRLVGGVAGLGLVASLTAFTVGSPVAAWADTITVRTAPSALAPAPTSAPGTSVDGAAGAPVMRALDPDDLAVDPPVMRALDDQPGATKTTATTATTAATDAPTTTLPTTASSSPPASIRPGPEPRPPPATERGTADQWVIERGDHLWGVARRTLAGAWSRPPTDVEVARYLDRLIEANGAVLVVPGDADLVLPGQVFTLPPVPAG